MTIVVVQNTFKYKVSFYLERENNNKTALVPNN